ncbi:MAG: Uma2 family endonuclease [Lachnospiraceae bacterium]|nr:Uma2 family endonuclease [Lachnospiraceae bacterium]
MMTIEKMQQIREARGISIAQLAEYTGVPVGTLTKIFAGVTKRPRPATLQAIERVLTGDPDRYSGRAAGYEARSLKDDTSPFMVSDGADAGVYSTISGELNSFNGDCDIPGPYRVSDIEKLPEDVRAELINGHLFYLESPTVVHQRIVSTVFFEFESHIRAKKKKCLALMAPTDVQIMQDDMHIFQPDLLVVCKHDRITKKRIYGAPDFVLEVLSPSTRRKDLIDKTVWYEKAGVRELWFIDPDRKKLQIYDWTKEHEKFQLVQLMPLEGKKAVAISDGELEIDLDEIREIIDTY